MKQVQINPNILLCKDTRKSVHHYYSLYGKLDQWTLDTMQELGESKAQYGHRTIDFSRLHHFRFKTELKAVMLYWLFEKKLKPVSFISNYFKSYINLLQFFNSYPDEEPFSLRESLPVKAGAFKRYMQTRMRGAFPLKDFLAIAYRDFHDHIYCVNYYNRSYWNYRDFKTVQPFFSSAFTYSSMDFSPVPDHNRKLFKEYILDLLTSHPLSYSTIHGRYGIIRRYLLFLNKEPAESVSVSTLQNFIAHMKKPEGKLTSFNARINKIRLFYVFLFQRGYIQHIPYIFQASIRGTERPHSFHSLSKVVIQQLFQALPQFPEQLRLMLMILYFTGMRCSECLTLKPHCFTEDHGKYYIHYYQPKMLKEVVNPIPQELYGYLYNYEQKLLKTDPQTPLLFPRLPGIGWRSQHFGYTVNKLCRQFKITEADGSPYYFNAHAFRHNYALRLVNQDVPFLTIQQLLHHKSPEMTLIYAQINEEKKKKRYLEFCNRIGQKTAFLNEEEKNIDDNLHWMRYMITQTLPNGYCSLPVRLGSCPHANACLFCDKFRTTKEFLPVLEYQLIKTKSLIRMLPQKKEVQNRLSETVKILQSIISHLQE